MKVVEIIKGQSEYLKKLAELNQSFLHSNLIETIRYCLKQEIHDCQQLFYIWKKKKGKHKTNEDSLNILKLFGAVSFKYVPKPEVENNHTPEQMRTVQDAIDGFSRQ